MAKQSGGTSEKVIVDDANGSIEWTDEDLRQLKRIRAAEERLPTDAPRALLSTRLSVLTQETTSPARQELGLRAEAVHKGYRIAGVASDLHVSATKVAPWKRPELGDWLNNRVPEFDAIYFWKLDRFVRNVNDMHVMIRWSEEYDKKLISMNDEWGDITSAIGKAIVTFVAAIAQIEAENTALRVTDLWSRTKTQSEWLVGKPAYGYRVEKDGKGKNRLVQDKDQVRALRRARRLIVAGTSTSRTAALLKEEGLMGQKLTTSTLTRRLRNPALLGLRVEEDKKGGIRRSKLVLDSNAEPITVAKPIFSRAEFDALQEALDERSKNQPVRQPGGATKFLGVLKCSDCDTNMTVKTVKNQTGSYSYLRCQTCRSGGLGAPNPELVYDTLVESVLGVLGDFPVEVREYARGEAVREEVKELEEKISHYMEGLEPGGRFTKGRFIQENAEKTLESLSQQLEGIDQSEGADRWIKVAGGKTYRQHWESGGVDAIANDLVRAGITCVVTRSKVPGQRAPQLDMKLRIPKDVRDRLLISEDAFRETF